MILPVPLPIWRADGDRPTIACACLSCQGRLLFIKDNNTLFELEIIIWARDMILSRSGLHEGQIRSAYPSPLTSPAPEIECPA
jgi:hypothetical protein